jgi:hypothetical protein
MARLCRAARGDRRLNLAGKRRSARQFALAVQPSSKRSLPLKRRIAILAAIIHAVLHHAAAGEFTFRHHYIERDLPGDSYGQSALVDLDRDGDLDFVTGGKDSEKTVYWFEFQAPDRWQRHVLGTQHPSDVGGTTLDVDGDGWPDHITGGVWYRNTGQPRTERFERVVFDKDLAAVHDLVVADLDGDKRPDIITMSDKNNLRWYRIPAEPRQPWERHDIGPGVHAGAAAGDIDGDGDLDIARSNVWFENADGKGLRWAEHAVPFGKDKQPYPLATRCVIADINRDGRADLVMTENEIRAGRIAWLENADGRGDYWKLHELSAGDPAPRGAYHSLAVADFDKDGDPDIFTVEMEAIPGDRPPRWFIWENVDGRGANFTERVILDAGLGGHEAVVADVDGDGDVDICSKLWRPRRDNANGGRNHADFVENLLATKQGFCITDITPADGARAVSTDVAIQAHVSARFDPTSITQDSVRLWHGNEQVAARVTSDLGGAVTISPAAPLQPDSDYRVEITAALKSAQGEALRPFAARFRTGRESGKAARTLPPFRKTRIGTVQGMTSLALARDGSLYAATWEGSLLRFRIDPSTGRPLAEPRIVWQDTAARITALCFDPDPTRNRHLWVALDDNAGESVCELRFTARIVRLTLPEREEGTVEVQEFITGLPIGDHAVSGLSFGPDGRLYFFCGAITMLGGEKKGARETPLSAAVLVADVRSLDFRRVNVNTEPPVSYDPRAKDAPVRLFATGIREAYDLCWHSNGQLYAGVNQNDTGEWSPESKSRQLPAVSVRADEPLLRIALGKYYGHPNPARNEWVLMGGNPTPEKDPWEISKLPVGTQPAPNFDPALLIYNLVLINGQSANGCAEWRGEGPLQGRLLIGFYTSARTVHTFAFSQDGSRVVAEEPLCDVQGAPLKFGAPLDLIIDNANSRLYVADFADTRRKDSAGEGALWLVEPIIAPRH